ncbi:MAG: MFS transporter, partial [Deltaproteobacteria bacterium]|nr:MFS transporter [Deltaproteobacteria bacterium]
MSGKARRFVFLLGWVSLFADLCYEGMRGAIGPYLAIMGASATAVGLVSGTGEAIGYALRYVTGAFADRTQRYWAITIAGYSVNLVAVPLLALAGSWPMVAVLVGLERLGKAVRSPAKSTLVSFAASDVGAGRAFAITEAMDQIGGLLGPLLVAGVLAWKGENAEGFAWAFVILGIPAALAVGILLRARQLYPDPRALDSSTEDERGRLGPRYRTYLVGVALIAIGLADWPLLAYHMEREGLLATRWLPVAYAAAMAADGAVALIAGTAFDRVRARGRTGAGVVVIFTLAGAGYAPFVLLADADTAWLAIIGVAMWSLTLAGTESIGKAMIATIVPR